jgi:AcrR family transcriptional regulator
MARTPKRPSAATPPPIRNNGKSARERVIEAFMAALADKPFEEIGFADLAGRADVPLAELRDLFGSTLEILAAQMKEFDRQVLAGHNGDGPADMADEPPRERLFDVLMRRLDVLAPHKPALRSLMRSARRNPGLALALNRLGMRSQRWMLTAADISATGPKGALRAQGLALLFATVLRTWLDDDDPGLARTMSALDRALARGQRLVGLMEEVSRIPACICRLRPRSRRRRRDAEEDEDTVAA